MINPGKSLLVITRMSFGSSGVNSQCLPNTLFSMQHQLFRSRVVNRAGLFGWGSGSGRIRANFGPDTMLTNKLSKNKIILLLYLLSVH